MRWAPCTMAPSEKDTVTIPTIFETCRPRKDVLQGAIANDHRNVRIDDLLPWNFANW